MEEKWIDIVGFEGFYQINLSGDIKSLPRQRKNKHGFYMSKERILNGCVSGGYLIYSFKIDKTETKLRAHRIVAQTFIPNPNNYPVINHKDGNKLNNNIDNLEWCTEAYNTKHAWDNGLIRGLRGEENGRAKTTEKQVVLIKKFIRKGLTSKEISEKLDLPKNIVDKIRCGKTWKHIK